MYPNYLSIIKSNMSDNRSSFSLVPNKFYVYIINFTLPLRTNTLKTDFRFLKERIISIKLNKKISHYNG